MTPEIVPRFFRVNQEGSSRRTLARLDWSLLAAVGILAGVGVLFILSATFQGGHPGQFLARQGLGIGVGLLGMILLALIPYQLFQTYAKGIYLFSVGLLVATLVLGVRLRGSRSWIDLGAFYFQPVEVTRLALAVALSAYAAARGRDLQYWSGSWAPMVLAGIHFVLVLMQPDLSSTLVMGPMTLAILFAAGAPVGLIATVISSVALAMGIPLTGTYFSILADGGGDNGGPSPWLMRLFHEVGGRLWGAAALAAVLVAGWWFLRRWRVRVSGFALGAALLVVTTGVAGSFVVDRAIKPYQRKRLIAFVNPEVDPLGAGYNIRQSEIAVGSGRVVGKGYLSGSQSRLGFLPEKHTDFIFSLLAEETGFLGAILFLAVYFWVSWRAFAIALIARDAFGRYLATAIGAFFGFSGLVNIGMTMGMMPVTGVPLPLMSYGGSGVVGSLWAVGLLLSIHLRRYIL